MTTEEIMHWIEEMADRLGYTADAVTIEELEDSAVWCEINNVDWAIQIESTPWADGKPEPKDVAVVSRINGVLLTNGCPLDRAGGVEVARAMTVGEAVVELYAASQRLEVELEAEVVAAQIAERQKG